MIIEQNTNYAYKLKYMENPTFDKVRDLAIRFMRELPKQLQDELYEALNRGIDILDSEPQMVTYLYAFGPMHQAKLNYAFKHLPEEFLEQPEINIIDYGCGQALGTMCYADFLRENGYEQKIKTITLIEPSEMCLKRAALHASVFFPEAEIKTINKRFDDLTQDDIYYDIAGSTLHLFSNVLDMLSFDLDRLAELLKGCWKDHYELGCVGYEQFVCVGPFFNYCDKDRRMDDFISLLDGDRVFRETFDKYEFDPEKAWTAQIQCFSVGVMEEENLSTVVTEDDLTNAVEDEYGVLYSSDGKKCLMASLDGDWVIMQSYSIKQGTKVICDNAFDFDANVYGIIPQIERIEIPNSVISIGNFAFAHLSYIEIRIHRSVISIGCNPFKGGSNVSLNSASSRFKIIESFLIDCEENRLISCLGSIEQHEILTIPDTIKTIGYQSFYDCRNIQKILIPNSVTTIEDYAFENCYSLTQISIPDSVIEIGRNPFLNCGSYESLFQLISSSDKYRVNDNLLIDVEKNTIISYFGNDSVLLVPDGIYEIGASAFKNNTKLKQIIFPDFILGIHNHAFEGCISLEQLIVNCAAIGDFAFAGCSSLLQVTIDSLYISDYVFKSCHKLKQVILTKVCFIGKNPFLECANSDHDFQLCVESSLFTVNNKMLIDKKESSLISYFGSDYDVVLPDVVTKIGEKAISFGYSFRIGGKGVELKGAIISIPNTISCIEKNAFDCYIEKLIIPRGGSKKVMDMLNDNDLWNDLVAEKRIIEQ